MKQIQEQRDDVIIEWVRLKRENNNMDTRWRYFFLENKTLKGLVKKLKSEVDLLTLQWSTLRSYSQSCDGERLNSQNELLNVKVDLDRKNNYIIKLLEEVSLIKLDQEVIGTQLKNLYESIQSLSNKKFVEDKFKFEIDNLNMIYKELQNEKIVIDYQAKALLNDRDKLRSDLKEMVKSRQNIIREKEIYAKATKERISELENNLQQKDNELSKKQDEFAKLDKLHKIMANERDKLKDR